MGRKKVRVKIVCKRCGKEFLVMPSQAKRRKCCSRKCQYESYRGKNRPRYKRVKVACQQCGREMLFTPHYAKKRKFCSRECFFASGSLRPFGRKGFFSQPLRELQIDGVTLLASVDYDFLRCQCEGIYNTLKSFERVKEQYSEIVFGDNALPEEVARIKGGIWHFQFVEVRDFPEGLITRFRELEKELGEKMGGQFRVLKVKPLEEEIGGN